MITGAWNMYSSVSSYTILARKHHQGLTALTGYDYGMLACSNIK
jgi:hypothetical protein